MYVLTAVMLLYVLCCLTLLSYTVLCCVVLCACLIVVVLSPVFVFSLHTVIKLCISTRKHSNPNGTILRAAFCCSKRSKLARVGPDYDVHARARFWVESTAVDDDLDLTGVEPAQCETF